MRDLGSKFGTFVLEENGNTIRVPPEEPHRIESGQTIRFGIQHSRIVFEHETMLLCATRLDKKEKERLKSVSKIIGARIVSHAEECTHLISNKLAATVKMLTAIAKGASVVTLEWLSFVDATTLPAEEIAPVDR